MLSLVISYPVFRYPKPDPLFNINEVIGPAANCAAKADEFVHTKLHENKGIKVI